MKITTEYAGPNNALRNAQQYQDVDTTIELFIEYIRKEYALEVPRYTLVDKSILYKNIKDFYQSRGSEKSFQFLFRIFFNEDISFFYPSETLLKPSDGKWIVDKSIKVTALTGDPFELKSAVITGETSGATALIEDVILHNESGVMVYELFLNIPSISGTFTAETITSGNITANISTTLYSYPGYYRGVDGQLDETIKLQDSKYFQAFSYVIRSGKSVDDWRDLVKQTIHPAGLALFGEVGFSTEYSFGVPVEPETSTILIEKSGVYWINNNSVRIPWLNKYNNEELWVTG